MRRSQLKHLLVRAEEETRLGLFDYAVASYQEVLAIAREGEFECELAHLRLGDLHLGQGEDARALRHLRCAQTLTEDEPEYALLIGRALIALGRPGDAASQLYDALRAPLFAADALAELAVAANLAGDRKTAGLLARKATAINATDPRFRALAREFADA
jgi:Flp pilus assembly protein TadD